MSDVNFMQVGQGGICFAHGPFTTKHCPKYMEWQKSSEPYCPCVADGHNPEYVALAEEQMRQTNKLYTQSQVDELLKAEREASAVIAETQFDNKWERGYRNAAIMIACAIRTGGTK